MPRNLLLVIDQGTTSTRAVVFDDRLRPLGQGQLEVSPSYPAPGWVEHDSTVLVDSVRSTVAEAIRDSGIGWERIAALGITNQRETTVLWDRSTGVPVSPAIVWQDRRTAELCRRFEGQNDWLMERTGLILDPYFSATKIRWILDEIKGVRTRAESGEVAFGTVDSLLLWHLTGGREHLTDTTNASRTLLMDLKTRTWTNDLSEYFGVPAAILPKIVPSSGPIARTEGFDGLPDGLPITGVAGDQQASLIGNGCVAPGQAKCTYGTGAFLLVNTGTEPVRSTSGLVTTPAASIPGLPDQYALEGSVFIAGAAVQWFRDGLRAIGTAQEINPLSETASAESQLLFVPALTGLGAPHWNPEARGTIFGISRGTSIPDLARSVIEGVAFQIADLVEAMNDDLPIPLRSLRADGGMARSDPFLQFQADLMDIPIQRSPESESTALGAALLAGLGVGLWPDLNTVVSLLEQSTDQFESTRDRIWRRSQLQRWRHAIESVRRHYATE